MKGDLSWAALSSKFSPDYWVTDDDTLAKMLKEPNPELWVIEKFNCRTHDSKMKFLEKYQDLRIFANLAEYIIKSNSAVKSLVLSAFSLFPNKVDIAQYSPFSDKIIRLIIHFYPYNTSASSVESFENDTQNLEFIIKKNDVLHDYFTENIDLTNLSLNDIIQFPVLLFKLSPQQLLDYLFGKTHDDLVKIVTEFGSWNEPMENHKYYLDYPCKLISRRYKVQHLSITIRYFLLRINKYFSIFFDDNPEEGIEFLNALFSRLWKFHGVREKLNLIIEFYNFSSDIEFLMKHHSENIWIVLAYIKFSDLKQGLLLNISDAIVAIFRYLADGHEFTDAHREAITMLYKKKLIYFDNQRSSFRQHVDVVHAIQLIQQLNNSSVNNEIFNKLIHLIFRVKNNQSKPLFVTLLIAVSVFGRDRVLGITHELEIDRKQRYTGLMKYRNLELEDILINKLCSRKVDAKVLTKVFTSHIRFVIRHSSNESNAKKYRNFFLEFYLDIIGILLSQGNVYKVLKMFKYADEVSRANIFYLICNSRFYNNYRNVTENISYESQAIYFQMFLDALTYNVIMIPNRSYNGAKWLIGSIPIFRQFLKNHEAWKKALSALMLIENETPYFVYKFVKYYQVSLLEFLKNYSMQDSEKGEASKRKTDKGKEREDSEGKVDDTSDENITEETYLLFLRKLLNDKIKAEPTLLLAYLHLRLGEYKKAYFVYSRLRKVHFKNRAANKVYKEATFGIVNLLCTGKIALDADENIKKVSDSLKSRQITGAILAYRLIFEFFNSREGEADDDSIDNHDYENGLQFKARIIKTLNQASIFSTHHEVPALDMPEEVFVEFEAYFLALLDAGKLSTKFIKHFCHLQAQQRAKLKHTLTKSSEEGSAPEAIFDDNSKSKTFCDMRRGFLG